MNRKIIIASSTFTLILLSSLTFISIRMYQANQRNIKIAEREEREQTMALLAKKAEEQKIQKLERLYSAKCSRDVDKIYYYNIDEKLRKEIKRGCVLSLGDPKGYYKKNKEAGDKKIDEYVQRQLNKSRTPSRVDYSHRERAYEYRNHQFNQNF